MKTPALILAIAIAASAAATSAESGAVGRFRPATSGYVVLQVPARAANDPLAALESQYASERSQGTATRLAALYLERARASREQRYFARAESLVQPWLASAEVQPATLRVQADILQNRHDFAGALTLLDRAIAMDAQDASARLMRASVHMVQGRPEQARFDCASVLAAGESAVGTICLAQVLGATGDLARGRALIDSILTRQPQALPPAVRAWALELLADIADRMGDVPSAERLLREALALAPENEAIRTALADLLLARGALREALTIVEVSSPSIGLLARRAHAQRLLRDTRIHNTRERIDDLLVVAQRRGDTPHLREEALIALNVDQDIPRALTLARANFAAQRETIDARLLARAARASGDREALRELADWRRETGFRDAQLASPLSSQFPGRTSGAQP